MKKIKAGVVILAGVLSLTLVGCNMIERTPESIKNSAVAKVNGKNITLEEVDLYLKELFDTFKSKYGEKYMDNPKIAQQILNQRQKTLNKMINEKILVAVAEKEKIVPSQEELTKKVDDQIEGYKNKYKADDYKKTLEKMGFTEESFKEYLKNQIIGETTINNLTKDIKVTEEEQEKYYNENKKKFIANDEGVLVKHLLFDNELDAQKAYDQIQSKETTFNDLYTKYENNKYENKKPIAENIGVVSEKNSKLIKEFLDGLKPLKEGEVSKPVKTKFGYHIIQAGATLKKGEQMQFNDVKSQIIQTLNNQKKSKALKDEMEKWKKEFDVKIYDDNLKGGLKVNSNSKQ